LTHPYALLSGMRAFALFEGRSLLLTAILPQRTGHGRYDRAIPQKDRTAFALRAVHSQPKENTMSNLSRRSLVASAAALPSLAVPAIAEAAPSGCDKAAMVRRAEQAVDLLATRYIRAGWHESFDQDRAAKFLQAVRRYDISAEDVDHQQKIADWIYDHGQSLDWILSGDPSSMICYLAGNTTRSVYDAPAVAAVPTDESIQIAEKMIVEYDRLGTFDRDFETGDWATYDSLNEQLGKTPARSIEGVIAKARILDQRLRIDGEPHSVLDSGRAWHIIDDLLALRVQS
jgi:hypothetical protein